MPLTVQFGGGCESFFGDQTKFLFTSQPTDRDDPCTTIECCPENMRELICLLKNKLLTVKEELFLTPVPEASGDGVEFTIRPGILTLIDDVDWEILGTLEASLKEVHRVTFISTLHGG
ncbi:hypothetical protein XU18_1214 [Perkinsela sp. CCAP 1560/4]|nr:hypothetical protein XU18_1214 [Perkinsela sp. CCAP 1560/4]|eukprot:KNH08206.1 hypothetical protein XU18_1214 [Perkinsela sp. CCAP 1560/4]